MFEPLRKMRRFDGSHLETPGKEHHDLMRKKVPQSTLEVLRTALSNNCKDSSAPRDMDENRICQWYCCSCGQSYGTIIYKNGTEDQPEQMEEGGDMVINRLKYYSLVVYNSKKSIDSGEDSPISPLACVPDGELYLSDHIQRSNSWTLGSLYNHSSGTHFNTPSSPATDVIDCKDVTICEPTRFTCRRCVHMMCPYCLKIRLKDLTTSKWASLVFNRSLFRSHFLTDFALIPHI